MIAGSGTDEEVVGEASFTLRPELGSDIDGKYRVLSISEPVPIGTNLSAGEPVMGLRIRVQHL